MATCRKFARVDVAELKLRLVKQLGRRKADKYFSHLTRLLNLKLTKLEFDKLCYATIGKENIGLHNLFIRAIISNAFVGIAPPSRQAATGHSGTNKAPSGQFGDVVLPSPRKVRTVSSRDQKRLEVTNSCDFQPSKEQLGAPEVRSVGKVVSVEDGEEVEQVRCSPCVQSRSPITAPLGISKALREGRRGARLDAPVLSCCDSGQLLDTRSLCKGLQRRLETEGLAVSLECADVLNNGLDEFLRRLIKPCMDLSRARSSSRRIGQANGKNAVGMNGLWQYNHVVGAHHTSLQDFLLAMESNPRLLGTNWPTQLEKIQTMSLEE